ncbi:MAG: hypothetical protein AAB554_02620 [Patescibacteria group bacterium]
MRNLKALIAFACIIGIMEEARADRVHLPCDADLAASVGAGMFNGRTHDSSYGDIDFERIQPTFLRLEGTVFENCEADEADDDDRPKVTRRWFGRLNFYASITPEFSSLGFENKPRQKLDGDGNPVWQLDDAGDPVLDAAGDMIPVTENMLLKASLETDTDFSGGVGVRLSIYDHPHFHIETFAEYTGTFGWNPANAGSVVAHALELDLDVTSLVREHADLRYRWSMAHAGVTIAVPLRPNTIDRNRVTPFISFGRMRFRADIDLDLDAEVADDIERLGVNVASITERRTIEKSSWIAFLGARLDFNRNFSLEAGAAFWKNDSTAVGWFAGSATFRFDYPWKW